MVRVSADAVFGLARHLTGRDREIVLRLYDQQVLTTDQLELLFFSSRRRCQDRLLFLYRHRVVDRFYPPSPFGAGKPQAHWLLDEAGAILVATIHGVERKQLGWQPREDWAAHPQLAHRLEANRFLTDLIAAALPDPTMGVTAWYSGRQAAERLGSTGFLRPDAGFVLDVPAGAIECYLEWDRGTEPQAVLTEKLDRYRVAEGALHGGAGLRNALFVVPGPRRIQTLRRAYEAFAPKREWHRQHTHMVDLDGRWPLLAATAAELRWHGPLGRVWESITDPRDPRRALTELSARDDLGPTDLTGALGRRWRHQVPGFWGRLSPLHRRPRSEAAGDAPAAVVGDTAVDLDGAGSWIEREREAELEQARRELADARAEGGGPDLRSPAIDGLIDDDPDDGEKGQLWR